MDKVRELERSRLEWETERCEASEYWVCKHCDEFDTKSSQKQTVSEYVKQQYVSQPLLVAT